MQPKTLLSVFLSLLAPTFIHAQTFTSCNPLNSTNCPDDLALGIANYSIDFTTETMSSRVWNVTNGVVNYGPNGAEFTINQRFESPTVQTNFYIFFGQVEVIMQAATGQGIISSMVLESNDLDEVDWEFMGGNDSYVETNYFGKGNTTSYTRAIYYPVQTPQQTFHNYTVDWSSEKLDWYVDGTIVRTLMYGDANGGHDFPQTPMNLRLGIWAGGDPSAPNGTIEWAGGVTNYDNTPYTMTVKSVRVSDASRGTAYRYGDESGSWQSIQILNTTQPLKLDGNNDPSASKSVSQKWNSLSHTTKLAIEASAGGAAAIAILAFAFFCIRQRRAGRREKALEDAKWEKSSAELLAYRGAMNTQQPQQTPMMGGMRAGGGGGRNSWMLGGQKGFQRF